MVLVDATQECLYRARMNELDALVKAAELAGGQSALARGTGVKQGHVWWWINKSGQAPADKVLDIERAIDGAVTRHELRPDIYPFEDTPNGGARAAGQTEDAPPAPEPVPPDKQPKVA